MIPTTKEDPIDLLKKLVPANENRFHPKEISIQTTYEIVDKMKTSNTTGFNAISSRTLKMVPEITAICMTHAINCIVRIQRFPEALKITPIQKGQES